MAVSAAKAAIAREREAQAFELRKAGASFEAIGRQLGITQVGAIKAYRRALKRYPSPAQSEEGRLMEGARLDQLQMALWPRAIKGDLEAIKGVLAIMKRRAEMFAFDAPAEVNITLFIRQVYAELQRMPEADLLDVLGYDADALPEPEE